VDKDAIELAAFQKAFYEGIFNPTSDSIQLACQTIQSTEAISAKDRLAIYRGSILGGMTTALAGIYPVCEKLVGENYFTNMVAGYLKQYPSGSPDLGNYGEHLSAYIATFEPAKDLVYLADVVQLEWLLHKAFNAPDIKKNKQHTKPVNELAHISEQNHSNIKFSINSSARLLESPYPINRIWEVNQSSFEGYPSVNLDEGDVKLIIWRNSSYDMCIDILTNDEYLFLSAISEDRLFGDIAEMELATSVAELLPRCLQMGLIDGFTLIEDSV